MHFYPWNLNIDLGHIVSDYYVHFNKEMFLIPRCLSVINNVNISLLLTLFLTQADMPGVDKHIH